MRNCEGTLTSTNFSKLFNYHFDVIIKQYSIKAEGF